MVLLSLNWLQLYSPSYVAIDETIESKRAEAQSKLDCPELQQYRVCRLQFALVRDLTRAVHQYDLRAVLVHDGLYGRSHLYSYIKHKGQWWKTLDYHVTKVCLSPPPNSLSTLTDACSRYLKRPSSPTPPACTSRQGRTSSSTAKLCLRKKRTRAQSGLRTSRTPSSTTTASSSPRSRRRSRRASSTPTPHQRLPHTTRPRHRSLQSSPTSSSRLSRGTS